MKGAERKRQGADFLDMFNLMNFGKNSQGSHKDKQTAQGEEPKDESESPPYFILPTAHDVKAFVVMQHPTLVKVDSPHLKHGTPRSSLGPGDALPIGGMNEGHPPPLASSSRRPKKDEHS
jgi:hypothetical protein